MTIKPGSASREVVEESPEFDPPFFGSASVGDEPETPIDPSRVGRAHYAGMNELEAGRVFHEECLCVSCFQASMCKIVAAGIEDSGTVISRCVAYLPSQS